MENREEVAKEDDLEILSKEDNISERENAENESRSEENQSNKTESRSDKPGAIVKNAASAVSQQPTSQVRHYYSAKIFTTDHQVPEFDAAQVGTSSVFQKTSTVFDNVHILRTDISNQIYL